MLTADIKIQLRNINTLEVEQEIDLTNHVVFSALQTVNFGTGYFYQVALINRKIDASFYMSTNPSSSSNSFIKTIDTAVPGVTSPDITWATLGDPIADVTFSGRFNPPSASTTRTTYSLCLLSVSLTNGGIYAVAPLTTPCVQTDSQFLDVYYRLHVASTSVQPWQTANVFASKISSSTELTSAVYTSPFKPMTTKYLGTTDHFVGSYPANDSGDINTLQANGSTGFSLGSNSSRYDHVTYSLSFTTLDKLGLMIGDIGVVTTPTRAAVSIFEAKMDSTTIGNTLPHGASSLIRQYDIDNTPVGKGDVRVEGTWDYEDAPGGPGLYYTARFPHMYYIDVTGTGNNTTATYRWRKIPFFGSQGITTTTDTGVDRVNILPFLTNAHSSVDDQDRYGESVFGRRDEITYHMFNGCDRYDDTSVVILARNRITIYNIAASDYWTYNGSYTHPSQLAVRGDDLYVGCRDTGLWRINPKTETSFTQITPAGFDSANCYGVHLGFGNDLWAVFGDGLGRFNGTTWTKYDSGSTPAFNVADLNVDYSRIAYLKVDTSHADNRMILVRTTLSGHASFGAWWDTTEPTPANTWADTQSNSIGQPRMNKGHVRVRGGRYFIYENSSNIYDAAFGATSRPTTLGTTTGTPGYKVEGIIDTDFNGNPAVIHFDSTNSSSRPAIYAARINETGQSVVNVSQSAMNGTATYQLSTLGSATATASNTFEGSFNGQAIWVNFIQIQPGVIVMYYLSSGFNIYGMIFNYTWTSGTNTGTGTLDQVGVQEYGWNGSAWELDNPGSRTAHATDEIIEDGITVRFENGLSEPSFSTGDFYNVVAADAMWKDNGTSFTMTKNLYYIPSEVSSDISNAVIGSRSDAQATGVVGIDAVRSSPGITQDVDNTFIVDVENSPATMLIGDIKLAGDFEVRFDYTNSSTYRNQWLGIQRYLGFNITNAFRIDSSGTLTYTTEDDYMPTTVNSTTVPTMSSTVSTAGVTYLYIKRTGTSIELGTNLGVLRTRTDPFPTDMYIFASSMIGNLNPWYHLVSGAVYNCDRFNAINVVTNGNSTGVKLGNGTTTGAYSSSFFRVEASSMSVAIDGTPVSTKIIGTTLSAPNAGEVAIDEGSGILYFNAADNGSTVTATYTVTYLPT